MSWKTLGKGHVLHADDMGVRKFDNLVHQQERDGDAASSPRYLNVRPVGLTSGSYLHFLQLRCSTAPEQLGKLNIEAWLGALVATIFLDPLLADQGQITELHPTAYAKQAHSLKRRSVVLRNPSLSTDGFSPTAWPTSNSSSMTWLQRSQSHYRDHLLDQPDGSTAPTCWTNIKGPGRANFPGKSFMNIPNAVANCLRTGE